MQKTFTVGGALGLAGAALQIGQAEGMIHPPGYVIGLLFCASLVLLVLAGIGNLKPKRGAMSLVLFVLGGSVVGAAAGGIMYWSVSTPPKQSEHPATVAPTYTPPIDTIVLYTNLNLLEEELLRQEREREAGVEIRRTGIQPPRIYGPMPPRKVKLIYESDHQRQMAEAIGGQFASLGWHVNYLRVRNDYNWNASGIEIYGKDPVLLKSLDHAIEDALTEKKLYGSVSHSPSDDPVLSDSIQIQVAMPPSSPSKS